MMHPKDEALIEKYNFCAQSRAWLKRNKFQSLAEAWQACKMGGWMQVCLEWLNVAGDCDEWKNEHLHTCTSKWEHPSARCKRCNAWADEIRAKHKCPVRKRSPLKAGAK